MCLACQEEAFYRAYQAHVAARDAIAECGIAIAVESPLQDDVRTLIAELNETLLALTPPEFCFHMTAEEMAEAHTTVFVARLGARALACGALRRHADGVGEVMG